LDCLDAHQNGGTNLSAGAVDSAAAKRLDTVLRLRELVGQLQVAEPPWASARRKKALTNARD
jgi:hypothetical protein